MRILPLRLLLAVPLSLGCTTITAHAQPATPGYAVPADGTLLNITSQAEAKHAPDVARLSAGVVTEATDSGKAMRENAAQMTKVLAAIHAAGIPEKDVQTSGISLNRQYTYSQNRAKQPNYQANNSVDLKVRDIAKLGKVLDALAAQGANQINGPSFEIDNPEPLYDQARGDALKKAQARAQNYAKTLGLRVRRIVSISEGNSGGVRPPMAMMRAMATNTAIETPVAPGESSVSVSLDVVFELGK
ncbi:SIMPL domain-containing protein [Xanthomonas albilineans]|uniref:SIMPL domain-containing protein n=1 Tax=Xanthomonas albilineans TaxID=29447 RepID=UPI0005F302BE|nr:SIMPL domain-containing protein [Xanthomonas albilineans]PPU93593.1 DUF541 domain-containing protein [Xanthomonas albilineans]